MEGVRPANVEGTRNVLRACRAAGVARAVHVSTEAVLMHGQPLVHADESYPLALRSKAPYSRSKAMAEQVVLEEGHGALEVMIVRPRFVWGRGDTTLLPLLVEGTRAAPSAGSAAAASARRPPTSRTPSRASCARPSTGAAAASTSSPTATLSCSATSSAT